MKQFYSSLIINSKHFPGVHQVFKPRFNKEFFKRITANIAQLETQIKGRCKYLDPLLDSKHLKELKENAKKLVSLRARLEKTYQDDAKCEDILAQLVAIEDRIMPTVTRLPNRSSKLVPPDDVVIEEVTSDFMTKQRLAKVLSHRKLSYINQCYVKSVVGPNSHYYFGIGAKLQDAISNYFATNLERENFIPVSGLCLTKSAVVEATNSNDKQYDRDPARILTADHEYITLHLTESSREALVGLLTTLGPITSNNPVRLMTQGAAYRLGSNWFDGDDQRITQFETLNTLTLNSSIEQYSMKEYLATKDIIWASYKKLELPARLVQCSLRNMSLNEYDSHRIDVWLPSRQEWLQVARISHYLDHITVRVGMKRGHLIDSSVFDGQILFASIIENRQTSNGKFLIPDVLKHHTLHLSEDESANYFAHETTSATPVRVMHNHEQRRYLTKKNYEFGHSRKGHEITRNQTFFRLERIAAAFAVLIYILIDWDEIWYDYLPDGLRAFLYDYMYRPARRVWWYLVYEEGRVPPDVPYEKLDRREYERTMWDRKKDEMLRDRERGPAMVVRGDGDSED